MKKIGVMMKYKVQSGVRGPFQSTWYFSPLEAFITTPETKGRPTGMIRYTDPQKNCQPEVLSVPSPLIPGRDTGSVRVGSLFPLEGNYLSQKKPMGYGV